MSQFLLGDEQTTIVHTIKTLFSVRSGNVSFDEFKLNDVNGLIYLLYLYIYMNSSSICEEF